MGEEGCWRCAQLAMEAVEQEMANVPDLGNGFSSLASQNGICYPPGFFQFFRREVSSKFFPGAVTGGIAGTIQFFITCIWLVLEPVAEDKYQDVEKS